MNIHNLRRCSIDTVAIIPRVLSTKARTSNRPCNLAAQQRPECQALHQYHREQQ
jgi:hypothetical protein